MNILGRKKKNIEPWNIPFWERLKRLDENSSKKSVVYIYEQADTSTFRYRVYNMCQALGYSNSWVGTYFFLDELNLLKSHLKKVDVLVFSRTRWSVEINDFFGFIKKKNIPILFDIDDLVFKIDRLPLVINTLNVDFSHPDSYSYWFSYASRLWLMGNMCDGFVGTNAYLCERLSDTFNKKSFVVNNFLNEEQIAISEEIHKRKANVKRKKFVIGYFSGTPSHINDFKIIASEISDLLKKYPDMILEVVGFMEFPDFLYPYVKNKQIRHSPLVDFLTLQEKIAEADVNVIPLVNNEFTNCKSELKFFEASIVDTVTCATPTYVYEKNIQEGVTGFLCKEGEWFRAIEKIYKKEINLKDIIVKAREYCINEYSPKNQLKNIENMLETVIYH